MCQTQETDKIKGFKLQSCSNTFFAVNFVLLGFGGACAFVERFRELGGVRWQHEPGLSVKIFL